MPSPAAVIGGSAHIYVPDDDEQIDLGWTHIRVYWASSESASASLETTIALVSGQKDYTYNKTDALATDHFEWCLYDGADEGPRSERVPIGPPRVTREDIRQGVGQRLRLMRLGTVLASPTPTTTAFASTNLIDADASEYLYANWFVRFASGNVDGEVRRVRNKANSGYAPTTGVITANAFSQAPSSGDVFELWRPRGSEDSSQMVDEAMTRAAHRVWWEETFYLTIDANVSEYYLPAIVDERGVRLAEFSSDTYPTRPGWEPVPRIYYTREGGNRLASVYAHGMWDSYLDSGRVCRLVYARHGDAMDNDADYWSVPLQWAIAETGLEFLEMIATPGAGLEEYVDADRARKVLAREAEFYRKTHMPEARIQVELPR